jgi:hypothetical protein
MKSLPYFHHALSDDLNTAVSMIFAAITSSLSCANHLVLWRVHIRVHTLEDIDRRLKAVHTAAAKTQAWFRAHSGDGMELLRAMKFETIGFHPVGAHALNVVEQINQTFSYAVALAAARELLAWHPDAEGFDLAPGAHMSQPLDIQSVTAGLVGAEMFAAVRPENNNKIAGDLKKLELWLKMGDGGM